MLLGDLLQVLPDRCRAVPLAGGVPPVLPVPAQSEDSEYRSEHLLGRRGVEPREGRQVRYRTQVADPAGLGVPAGPVEDQCEQFLGELLVRCAHEVPRVGARVLHPCAFDDGWVGLVPGVPPTHARLVGLGVLGDAGRADSRPDSSVPDLGDEVAPGLRAGLRHGVTQLWRQMTGEDLLLVLDVPPLEHVVESSGELPLDICHPASSPGVQELSEHREVLLRRGAADQLPCQGVAEEVHVLTMVESRRRPRRGVAVVGEDDRAIVLRLRPHDPRKAPRVDLDELAGARPVGSDRGVHPTPGPVVPLTHDQLLSTAEAAVGQSRESFHRLLGLEIDQIDVRLVRTDTGVELSGGMQAGGGDVMLHLPRRPLRLRRGLLRGALQPHPAVIVPGAHVDHLRGGVLELERRRRQELDAGRGVVPMRVPPEADVTALGAIEQLEYPGTAVLAGGGWCRMQCADARVVLRRRLRAFGVDAGPEPGLCPCEDVRAERERLDIPRRGDRLEHPGECVPPAVLVGLLLEKSIGDVPDPGGAEGGRGLVLDVDPARSGDLRREEGGVFHSPRGVGTDRGESRDGLRPSRGHMERARVRAEELLEVRQAVLVGLERSRRGNDP